MGVRVRVHVRGWLGVSVSERARVRTMWMCVLESVRGWAVGCFSVLVHAGGGGVSRSTYASLPFYIRKRSLQSKEWALYSSKSVWVESLDSARNLPTL